MKKKHISLEKNILLLYITNLSNLNVWAKHIMNNSQILFIPGNCTNPEEHEKPGRIQWLGGHKVHNHHVDERKYQLKKCIIFVI